MRSSWLATAEPSCCWAHRSSLEFSTWKNPEHTVVVLPLHGLRCAGSAPLDQEESCASKILQQTLLVLAKRFSVSVLPPLRYVMASGEDGVLGLDFETCYDTVMEIGRDLRASGFLKLALLNTSEVNEAFLATVGVDLREAFGLQVYLLNTRTLGWQAGNETAKAVELAGLLEEIRMHRSAVLGAPNSSIPFDPVSLTPSGLFPSYRPFYLPSFSCERLLSLPNKDRLRIVLPTASIEQHGRHLPVGVDAILGQALLDAAFAGQNPLDAKALVLPPLCYGKSNEHAGFPGTLSLTAKTFRRQLHAIAKGVAQLGFRRLDVFNTHGGNTALLRLVLREINEEGRVSASLLSYPFEPELDQQEKAWGMHADEWETSLMLACAPELVRMEFAQCEYPARVDDPGFLRPEKSPLTMAWLTKDFSRSGVLGNAPAATQEKGKRWLAAAGESLRSVLIG